MKHNCVIVLFLFLMGFSSCWFPCAPLISGKVLNGGNGLPLDSVKVDFYEEGDFIQSIYTESTGIFVFSAKSEGVFMTKKCSSTFQLMFVKDGYVSQEFNGDAPSVEIEIKLRK